MTLRIAGLFAALLLMLAPAYAGKRVAFVLGVGAYTTQHKLASSEQDAALMGEFLKRDGFTLVGGGPLVDLDKNEIDAALEAFANEVEGADVVVFYYSGHGMQIGGTNYLFPADSPYVSPTNLGFRFVSMNTVMSILEHSGARLKIVFLDACRSNPFVRSGKSDLSGGGLAQMNAPYGTIIGFATQPGNTASDGGVGRNSPYTAAVYAAARKPGYNLFRVFNDAALQVMRNSGGRQQPWMSASPITDDFFFTPPLVSNISTAPVASSMASVMPPAAPLPSAPQFPAAASAASLNTSGAGNMSLNYIQEANTLFQQRNYAAGRAILTQGINAGQRTAIMHSFRGFSWFQDGLNNPDPHQALTMYRAGFDDFDAAIALERTYPNSYRHRGNMIAATWKALKRTGQRANRILDNAISDLQNAARLDPSSSTNAYFLGEAYNLRGNPGDYQSAMMWFARALEISPKLVAPHSGLCYAKRMLGDMGAARKEADYAAKHDSDQADRSCLTRTAWERYVPKY